MKLRGLMGILLVTLVLVYVIFFAKVADNKGGLQTEIDQYERAKVKLTLVDLTLLAREIQSFAAGEQGLPENLTKIQRFRPLGTALFDAWGREIRYERLTDTTFRLRSAGRDGRMDTADDITKDY